MLKLKLIHVSKGVPEEYQLKLTHCLIWLALPLKSRLITLQRDQLSIKTTSRGGRSRGDPVYSTYDNMFLSGCTRNPSTWIVRDDKLWNRKDMNINITNMFVCIMKQVPVTHTGPNFNHHKACRCFCDQQYFMLFYGDQMTWFKMTDENVSVRGTK